MTSFFTAEQYAAMMQNQAAKAKETANNYSNTLRLKPGNNYFYVIYPPYYNPSVHRTPYFQYKAYPIDVMLLETGFSKKIYFPSPSYFGERNDPLQRLYQKYQAAKRNGGDYDDKFYPRTRYAAWVITTDELALAKKEERHPVPVLWNTYDKQLKEIASSTLDMDQNPTEASIYFDPAAAYPIRITRTEAGKGMFNDTAAVFTSGKVRPIPKSVLSQVAQMDFRDYIHVDTPEILQRVIDEGVYSEVEAAQARAARGYNPIPSFIDPSLPTKPTAAPRQVVEQYSDDDQEYSSDRHQASDDDDFEV